MLLLQNREFHMVITYSFVVSFSLNEHPEFRVDDSGKIFITAEGYQRPCGFTHPKWTPLRLSYFRYETELVNDFESAAIRNNFENGIGVWFIVEPTA